MVIEFSPKFFCETNLDKTVSEIVKVVPKPIREALSKLSLDLASNSTASSPQLPELVQQFSKMLQSYRTTASESQIGSESTKPSSMKCEKIPNPRSTTQGRNTFFAPQPSSINPNADRGSDGKEDAKKSGGINLNAKPSWDNIKAVASSVLESHDKEVKKPSGVLISDYWKRNVAGKCPFAGTPIANEETRYDLCSFCFSVIGSEADNVRLDRPVCLSLIGTTFSARDLLTLRLGLIQLQLCHKPLEVW